MHIHTRGFIPCLNRFSGRLSRSRSDQRICPAASRARRALGVAPTGFWCFVLASPPRSDHRSLSRPSTKDILYFWRDNGVTQGFSEMSPREVGTAVVFPALVAERISQPFTVGISGSFQQSQHVLSLSVDTVFPLKQPCCASKDVQ